MIINFKQSKLKRNFYLCKYAKKKSQDSEKNMSAYILRIYFHCTNIVTLYAFTIRIKKMFLKYNLTSHLNLKFLGLMY